MCLTHLIYAAENVNSRRSRSLHEPNYQQQRPSKKRKKLALAPLSSRYLMFLPRASERGEKATLEG
jgi:hypothetical protein